MDIKPENLISLLQQHKPLPQAQVLLLCGEEDYYRNSIIAALPIKLDLINFIYS